MFATVEDVKSRWLTESTAGPIPATDAQLVQLIVDAEDIIETECPNIEQDVLAGRVRKTSVIRVVARMIIYKLQTSGYVRTATENTGPFGGSLTYAGDNPGELYLTDADKRALSGPRAAGKKAFTVSTVPAGWPWPGA